MFDESQREEAIRQANALMRQFLGQCSYVVSQLDCVGDMLWLLYVVCAGTRKYKAARDVLRKLPPDSVEVVKRNWQMMVKK